MARFDSAIDEVFLVKAAPAVVRAHFANPAAIVAATTEAERTNICADGTIHFVLQEQQHGPYRFQPDYVVHYAIEADALVWSPRGGNMAYTGRATFTARADGGTDLRYAGGISFELPIPSLLAGPIRGVVARLAQPSLRAYVRQMIASCPAA